MCGDNGGWSQTRIGDGLDFCTFGRGVPIRPITCGEVSTSDDAGTRVVYPGAGDTARLHRCSCQRGAPRARAHTGLLQDTRGPFKWVTDTLGSTPEKGADTVLWLATAPEAATVSGKLFTKRKEIRTPDQGSDPPRASALGGKQEAHEWQRAVDIVIGDVDLGVPGSCRRT